MDQILPKTDKRSPFNSKIPNNPQPTEILSKRVELWRQIIKSLIVYFKTLVISTQQQIEVNSNILRNSLNFQFFTDITKLTQDQYELLEPADSKKQSFFSPFGSGSVQDLQILLKKYHINLINKNKENAKELHGIVLRLEELNKDLALKIREIRGLNSDFKNDLNQEIAITGEYLNSYISVISELNNGEDVEPRHDPFLKKYKLETQLKQQINQENYLEEAFINLQTTALELEKIIFKEIKESLNKYSELISHEIFVHYNDLINELHQGIISKPPYFEWDAFVTRDNNKNLLPLKNNNKLPDLKKLSDIEYPYNDSLYSKTIRAGYLLKKSKLLKTYSKAYYVLTLNYLHEFRSDDLTEGPVHSIKLNDSILTDSNESKFQIHVNSNQLIKTHNVVFKKPDDITSTDFKKWIHDMKHLTSFDNLYGRYEYISSKLNTPSSQTPAIRTAQSTKIDVNEVNAKLEKIRLSTPPVIRQQTPPSLSTLSIPLPTLEIQEPTPIRVDAPELPIIAQTPPVQQHDPPLQSILLSHAPNSTTSTPSILSTPSRNIPSRVQTPMIGELNDNVQGPIDLGQRLYEDHRENVDLNKLLSQLKQ